MLDLLWLKAILKALVLPPTGPLLVAAAGLGIASRRPRLGRVLAVAGVTLLLFLSVPLVADLLVRLVDTSPTLDLAQARSCQAIVILGGGIRSDAPEYGGDTLSSLTLERVRYGAYVAHRTGLPVLVSGGSVLGGTPEAILMQAALATEFGVPVRWVESRSRTTHENALRTATMLRSEGISRVVLVAHGFDMRRAVAEFSAAGLATIAAPTGQREGPTGTEVFDYVPSIAGLLQSYYATYELLANAIRIVSAPGHDPSAAQR